MLTPEDIQGCDFLVSLRGFDRAEVRAFLAEVAAHVRDLEDRLEAAEVQAAQAAEDFENDAAEGDGEQARVPEEAPGVFADIGRETQRILEAAQEAAESIARKARADADREVQSARRQSARLIAEGEQRLEEAEAVVAGLEAARAALSGQLREIGATVERVIGELGVPPPQAATVREALTAGLDPPVAAPAAPPSNGSGVSEEPAVAAEPAEPTQTMEPDVSEEPEASAEPEKSEPPEEPEASREPAEPTVSAELEAPEEPEQPEEDPSDPHGLRDSALAPLQPQLVRAIKRALQDMQNVALDQLRRTGDAGEIESFLPGEEGMAEIGVPAVERLAEAYTAGAAAASLLVDRDLPEPVAERRLVDEFLADASDRVRTDLAATLRMARSADEDIPALVDRIGAVFAELRGTVAEQLSAMHLMRAYELGLVDAWAAGGITHRRWIVGREPRCPEARCRHNGQAGVVAMGAAYPSGHEVPPVHVGCTCTTIPVSEPPS